MARDDLSNYLVHWIKGDTDQEAFDILHRIVSERRLLGGVGRIKGGYRCVCFTEAPENTFHKVMGRYRPFGVQVSKKWLFSQGGRPVIYQAGHEFNLLSESHKWRHVRYEPDADPPIDFTWEREWRILADEVALPAGLARILVPHEDWAHSLEGEHEQTERGRIQMEAIAYGEEWLFRQPQAFQYEYSVIDIATDP